MSGAKTYITDPKTPKRNPFPLDNHSSVPKTSPTPPPPPEDDSEELDIETKQFIANQEGRVPEFAARFTGAATQSVVILSQHNDSNEDFILTEGAVFAGITGLLLGYPIAWLYKRWLINDRKERQKKLRPNEKLPPLQTELNPVYRSLKTIIALASLMGTLISYFIPIKAAQKIIVGILSPAFGLIIGLFALPFLIYFSKNDKDDKNKVDDKKENLDLNRNNEDIYKTNHEGWSKYCKSGLVYGMSVGCLVGGILALTTGLFSSVGAAIAITGAAAGIFGFIAAAVLVPLINWLRKPATESTPNAKKDPLDKDTFRNNYPRVGITVGAALFAILGFFVGTMLFPGLGAMVGLSLGAALGGVIGGPVFTLLGPKVTRHIDTHWRIKNNIKIISDPLSLTTEELTAKTYFLTDDNCLYYVSPTMKHMRKSNTLIDLTALQEKTSKQIQLIAADGYNLTLLSLAEGVKLEEKLKTDAMAKDKKTPILIKRGTEFSIFGRQQGGWKETRLDGLSAEQLKILNDLLSFEKDMIHKADLKKQHLDILNKGHIHTDEGKIALLRKKLQELEDNKKLTADEKRYYQQHWITRITGDNETNNSWDYAMRSTAYVFAFLGTFIGLLAFSVPGGSTFMGVNFVGAILGGAIASLVGAIVGIVAIKVARHCQDHESKSSILPWSQRICVWATTGSLIGAAIGFVIGLLIGGPGTAVMGAAIGASGAGFISGCIGAFSDGPAWEVWTKLWKRITGQPITQIDSKHIDKNPNPNDEVISHSPLLPFSPLSARTPCDSPRSGSSSKPATRPSSPERIMFEESSTSTHMIKATLYIPPNIEMLPLSPLQSESSSPTRPKQNTPYFFSNTASNDLLSPPIKHERSQSEPLLLHKGKI